MTVHRTRPTGADDGRADGGEKNEKQNRILDSLLCAFGYLRSTRRSSRCLSIQNSHWTIRLARNPVIPPITALNRATRKSCRHCCFRNSFSLASFNCCSRTLYGTTEPFAILGFFISISPPIYWEYTTRKE